MPLRMVYACGLSFQSILLRLHIQLRCIFCPRIQKIGRCYRDFPRRWRAPRWHWPGSGRPGGGIQRRQTRRCGLGSDERVERRVGRGPNTGKRGMGHLAAVGDAGVAVM